MNNKWTLYFFLLLALIGGFYLYNKYKKAPTLQFENLSLSTLDNESFKLSSLKGKKIVLCFGASWCVNCIEELDDLSKIKNNDLADVEVIVISDESIEKINAFKKRKNYPFTFLKLNQSFGSIEIHSIPTSYIINKNFEIKKQTVGYLNWLDASTLQHLKTLMD